MHRPTFAILPYVSCFTVMASPTRDEMDMTRHDSYRLLREREQTIPNCKGRSLQLDSRWRVVDWISSFEFPHTVIHLAVLLLDLYLDTYVVLPSQLYAVAIGCIVIAGIVLLLLVDTKYLV